MRGIFLAWRGIIARPNRGWLAKIVPGLLLLALLLAALVLMSGPGREPAYQSRPLTQWLADYEKTFQLFRRPASGPAADAIRSIGPAAIPVLLARLQEQDILPKKWLASHSWASLCLGDCKTEEYSHTLGVAGFAALGPLGRAAETNLVVLLGDRRPVVRRNAPIAMGYVGSLGEDSVKALIERTDDSDYRVSVAAIWALGNLREQSGLVVPALVRLISQRDPPPGAFEALAQIGPQATGAVPKLLEIANGKDIAGRFHASEALKEIAPQLPLVLNAVTQTNTGHR